MIVIVKRPLCIISLLFGLILAGILIIQPVPAFRSSLEDGQAVIVSGQVYKKEIKNDKHVIYLKNTNLENANGCIVYLKVPQQTRIGNLIQVSGKLKYFSIPTNPGQFNQKKYYQILKIDASVLDGEIEYISEQYHFLPEQLHLIREKFMKIYPQILDETSAGIVSAMLFGEKSLLDAEIKALYQRNGISHILAISGLHISLIGMGIYKILRKTGLSIVLAGVLGSAIMICYSIMTGLGTSTYRALIMFLLAVIADMIGRSYDLLSALALSFLFLLLEQPMYLFHAGFLLSFGAVLGIGMILPLLEFLFPLKTPLFKAFLANLSIFFITFPISLGFYYEFPIYSIFLNLLIVPLMTFVLLFGLTGGIAGFLSLTMGTLLIKPCYYILNLYEKCCNLFETLPAAVWVTGQPSAWQIIFYYTLLLLLLMTGYRVKIKYKQQKAASRPAYEYRVIFLICTVCMVFLFSVRNHKGLLITMLDVGQGDAIFMKSESGTSFLIDGGSSDVKQVGKYRILPFLKHKGVQKLNYALISHLDADHINGLQELISLVGKGGIPIENIVMPYGTVQDDAYGEMLEMAEEKGIRILYMKQGDTMRDENLQLTCLHPSKDYKANNRNDDSMVLYLKYKEFEALMTGDIENSGETLLPLEAIGGQIELLKVAHHGSKNSSSMHFLEQIRPAVSIVSCGVNNRYGHPHEELVQRLEAVNSKICITNISGAISIRTDGKEMGTSTYLKNTR